MPGMLIYNLTETGSGMWDSLPRGHFANVVVIAVTCAITCAVICIALAGGLIFVVLFTFAFFAGDAHLFLETSKEMLLYFTRPLMSMGDGIMTIMFSMGDSILTIIRDFGTGCLEFVSNGAIRNITSSLLEPLADVALPFFQSMTLSGTVTVSVLGILVGGLFHDYNVTVGLCSDIVSPCRDACVAVWAVIFNPRNLLSYGMFFVLVTTIPKFPEALQSAVLKEGQRL